MLNSSLTLVPAHNVQLPVEVDTLIHKDWGCFTVTLLIYTFRRQNPSSRITNIWVRVKNYCKSYIYGLWPKELTQKYYMYLKCTQLLKFKIVIILTLTLPATLLMKHRPSVHSTPYNKYMKLGHLNATTWLLKSIMQAL